MLRVSRLPKDCPKSSLALKKKIRYTFFLRTLTGILSAHASKHKNYFAIT